MVPLLVESSKVFPCSIVLAIENECDGIVELKQMAVAIQLDRLLVGQACILDIIQPCQGDRKAHVRRGEIWFDVD